MNTNASEIMMQQEKTLIEQAREIERTRERLRLLKLSQECGTIEELQKRLLDLLTTQGE